MKSLKILIVLLIAVKAVIAQEIKIDKIEPPNWWANMKHNKIQLMVYGNNLNNLSVKSFSSDIIVKSISEVENESYTFVNLILKENIKPGNYDLAFIKGNDTLLYKYPIKSRDQSYKFAGFDETDIIYLITPDRFSNGDISNDTLKGHESETNYDFHQGRHGGDIQGIIDRLDYLKDLGVTSIWINPLVENKTWLSYHGYSATDFYNIDPRFGDNELYKKLVSEAHKRGLKIILDHVTNHCSIDHPWIKNLPTKSWIHGTPENHKEAFHHKMIFTDIHSDSSLYERATEGWFIGYMPDLNQRDPLLANYIIQNTIWWIEYAGIDGIREDTYPYNDIKFMSKWAKEITKEYPHFNILAEVWTGEVPFLAPFQKGSIVGKKINSYCGSVTDFPLRDKLTDYLIGKGNLFDIYNVLAKDYLYADPNKLVTFIDNHDVQRIMFSANGNFEKASIALAILFTTRGIPQILYGTEIGMKGTPEHGYLRADFPGGFPNSTHNAFSESGRTEQENKVFDLVKKLIGIRKKYTSLQKGRLIQFPPSDNSYVYFRKTGDEAIMVVINDNNSKKYIDLKYYNSQLKDFNFAKDLISGKSFELKDKISVGKTNFRIIKLIK